jgi:MFS-type transporter involved in bile tolerance (Atg22 family)
MAHLRTLVLVLWWLAVSSLSGVTNMAANLALHAIGIAVLLLVLLVPSLGRGVDRRLAGHLRHGT